ncbi:MAG: type II toxin-antitoxin system Phd/YefM family antitoxin [Cardiobacteriaceae bacterium]|nr:type II toxin-antitoxin system Phd/YefM family antitoxin [Cardiobacteriaceae bacterium]
MPTVITYQELNRQISQAQKLCEQSPVFVTNRNELSYVLMSYQEYLKLSEQKQSIAEALAFPNTQTEIEDIEFERMKIEERNIDIRE